MKNAMYRVLLHFMTYHLLLGVVAYIICTILIHIQDVETQINSRFTNVFA